MATAHNRQEYIFREEGDEFNYNFSFLPIRDFSRIRIVI